MALDPYPDRRSNSSASTSPSSEMSQEFEVSVRFDTILVHYLVEEDLIWWPVLVEDVSCTGIGSEKRASGVLIFDSRLGYDEESVPVDFFRDGMLREQRRLQDGSLPEKTQWRLKDDGCNGDSDNDDFTDTYRGEENRRSTRIASGRRNARKETTRHRTRRSTRTRNTPQQTTPRNANANAVQELLAEVQQLKGHVHVLHRKIAVHEQHFLSDRNKRMTRGSNGLLNALKTNLRYKLLIEFQKPPRRPTVASHERPFHTVLRRGHVTCSMDFDLNILKSVADDVVEFMARTSRQVKFFPSLTSIMEGPHGMPLAKIVFSEDIPLLQWLGMRNPQDRDKIRFRAQCTQAVQAIRLVCGVQLDNNTSVKPMCLFPGKSSCVAPFGNSKDSSRGVNCLQRCSTLWVQENETFLDSLECVSRDTGISTISDIEHDTSSCIMLTWIFRDCVSRNMWSLDASNTGDVTLGTLEIQMPTVCVYGMRACAEVEEAYLKMSE